MSVQREEGRRRIDLSVWGPDGSRYRIRRLVYGSQREAARYAREIRESVKAELLKPQTEPAAQVDEKKASPLLFNDFAKDWFETYVKANNKPSEIDKKRSLIWRHLVPFFDNQNMREIGAQDLERYKAAKLEEVISGRRNKKKKKTLSPKTINNHIIVLKKMFNSCVEWGYLEKNPLSTVKKLKVDEYEWDFMVREESDAFLAACEPRWLPVFATLLWTGARPGELIALRWQDIDWRNEKIIIRRSYYKGQFVSPKSGKKREVPMNSRLAQMLKAEKHLKGELVFCTDKGTPLDGDDLKRPYQRALRKAGLRMMRVYDLRHSFASQLVMKGVPLKAVQELLGHASIMMTLRYAHLAPGMTRTAVETLVDDLPVGKSFPAPFVPETLQ